MPTRTIRGFPQSLVLLMFFALPFLSEAQCSSVTPTFTLDLSGAPNSSSVTPTASRNGTCCNGTLPCVKIVVILHPNAMALELVPTGADPGGALTYEFNCNGIQYPGGTRVCLNGTGPQTLTICKVGNNPNAYSVTSVPRPTLPDSVHVRNGCQHTLSTTGFSVPTIQWSSVPSNTLYNSYLNCTSGCASVIVTPTGTPPAFVDYMVSGTGANPCGSNTYRDTVRVFFYSNLAAPLSNTTICYGSNSAVLSPTPTGGRPGYTYTWSTSSNSSSITVGPGNYTLTLGDQTGCPPITSTVAVGIFTLPISANAGPDQALCKSATSVVLSGSVVSASGGSWTAGSGTFAPSAAVLNPTFFPTSSSISSGSVELILATTGNQGCPPDQDTVLITFQNQPTVVAVADQTVCANNNLSVLTAIINGYSATAVWSSVGGGTLSPPVGQVVSFSPTAAQVAAGSATVFVNTSNNGSCAGDADTVIIFITPAPVVNAGPNQTICSTGAASLNGSVTVAAFSGSWSTSGDGSFSNSSGLATSYTPGSGDISTGTVNLVLTSTNNGNCTPVSDTTRITITKIATVTVSAPLLICSSTPVVGVSATASGASGTGTWSSSGSGTFGNNSSLQTTYGTSSGDITNGSVTFSFTSTGNGPCAAVTAATSMSIAPLATVVAGTSQVICSSQTSILMSAGQPTVFGSTNTGVWTTTASGNFSNASNYLGATYSLSANDLAAGVVLYTLTSTGNGICPPVSDTVHLRIIPQPTVLAAPPQTLCVTLGNASLNGTITGGTGTTANWLSSGNGTFTPGSNTLNTTYNFSGADITAGVVTFTVVSGSNGPCAAQQATTQLQIVRPATVTAGQPQLICSSQAAITLSGTVSGGGGTGAWVTNGSGTYASQNSVTTTYTLSNADKAGGLVQFTLVSTNNGPCPPHSSSTQVQITTQPTLIVGPSSTLCSLSPTAALTATLLGGLATASWSTLGDGTFNPSNTALNTMYVLGPNEQTGGAATVTISTSNHQPCPVETGTIGVTLNYPAVVSAGGGQLICSSQGSVALSGIVVSASSTGSWSSSGSGNLQPPTSLNTTYLLSPGDISAGQVNFTLTSMNNGACPPRTATVSVQVTTQPTVYVSSSQTLCSVSNSAVLSGTLLSQGGTASWSASGSGSFLPSPAALSPAYAFSSADVSTGSVVLVLASSGNTPCAESSASLTIFVQSPAVVSTGSYASVCSASGSVTLQGNVNGGLQTGQWTSSGTGTFNPGNTDLQPVYYLSPGDITLSAVNFTLTSTNNGACPADTKTTTVPVTRQSSITAAADASVCSSELTIPLQSTLTGNSPGVTWTSNGAGTIGNPGSSSTTYTIGSADITSSPITFTVQSLPNGPCPSASDSLRLFITPRPVVQLKSDTTVCANQNPVALKSLITNGSGGILWVTTGTGSFSPGNFLENVEYHMSADDIKAGKIQLSINSTDNGACGDISASMQVSINPSPLTDFSVSQSTVTLPADPIQFTNLSKQADQFWWYINDDPAGTTANLTKNFTTVGFYSVTLAAENEFGCVDTARKVITVISTVKFPTAFTPNNDKLNDAFFPYTDGVVEYELNIYNRWGELIFRSENLRNGWDGKFNGKVCQQDVYVWTARMVFFDGRKFEDSGTVTLIR